MVIVNDIDTVRNRVAKLLANIDNIPSYDGFVFDTTTAMNFPCYNFSRRDNTFFMTLRVNRVLNQ